MDDQLAGLVVEGELAEVLEEENEMSSKTRKESFKALTNTIWSMKKKQKTDHPKKKRLTIPHARS